MKKILFAVILCLSSSTAFIYTVITCYNFLYTIVLVLAGFLTLTGMFVLRNSINDGKRYLANILLATNMFFAIWAIGSIYYIYNKYDGKITYSITDKQTAKELGILVAEYRQVNHVSIDNTDIQGNIHVAYNSIFAEFNDRSKIIVYPKLYNIIISMNGDKVVDMFDWRTKKYDFHESFADLTTIRTNNDGEPVYTTGTRELVDSIRILPDTVTFHIFNRQTAKDVDSLVYVKDKEYNNLSIKKGSDELFITRKRTLVDRIKDLYLID